MLRVVDVTKVRDYVPSCQRNTEELWYSQCYGRNEHGRDQVVQSRCSNCRGFDDCGKQAFDLGSYVRGGLLVRRHWNERVVTSFMAEDGWLIIYSAQRLRSHNGLILLHTTFYCAMNVDEQPSQKVGGRQQGCACGVWTTGRQMANCANCCKDSLDLIGSG
jgi:hypothetical protein